VSKVHRGGEGTRLRRDVGIPSVTAHQRPRTSYWDLPQTRPRFEIPTFKLDFRHRSLRSELTLNAAVAYLKSVWGLMIRRTDYLPEIHFGPSKTRVYKRLKISFTCFQHFKMPHVPPPLRGFNLLVTRHWYKKSLCIRFHIPAVQTAFTYTRVDCSLRSSSSGWL
jgi:hypothetical protein